MIAAKRRTARSIATAAAAVGVNKNTFTAWMARLDTRFPGHTVRLENGGYDLDEFDALKTQYQGIPDRSGDSESTDDPKLRKLLAECDKLEEEARFKKLKNDILEGTLYPSAEVDQYLARNDARIKTRLEQFPGEAILGIAPEYRDAVRQALETAVHNLLIEMSGWEFEPSGEVPSEE